MEEPKVAQDSNPPTSTTAAAPPPPQPPPPEQPTTKKRPLENSNDLSHNSKSFKMRLILKNLRPHFIEVLRTPDFRNCKAANEILEQTKLLLELYKQLTAETVSTEKSNDAPGHQPLPDETGMKLEEEPQVDKPAIPSENKAVQSSSVSEKQESVDGEAPGSYVVGGSAFGWNFITFTGSKPVYCGVTKESFRSAQATLGGE